MTAEPEKENDVLDSLLREEENLSEIDENSIQPEPALHSDVAAGSDASDGEEADTERRTHHQTERTSFSETSASKTTRSRAGRRSGSSGSRRKRQVSSYILLKTFSRSEYLQVPEESSNEAK
jgi:hypothetical protein